MLMLMIYFLFISDMARCREISFEEKSSINMADFKAGSLFKNNWNLDEKLKKSICNANRHIEKNY